MFIHTVVDLMNTIIIANFRKEKEYQYEIISNRLLHKIKSIYNDKLLLEKIDEESNRNIRIQDAKVSFIQKKLN